MLSFVLFHAALLLLCHVVKWGTGCMGSAALPHCPIARLLSKEHSWVLGRMRVWKGKRRHSGRVGASGTGVNGKHTHAWLLATSGTSCAHSTALPFSLASSASFPLTAVSLKEGGGRIFLKVIINSHLTLHDQLYLPCWHWFLQQLTAGLAVLPGRRLTHVSFALRQCSRGGWRK